jgi:hypothetical protein
MTHILCHSSSDKLDAGTAEIGALLYGLPGETRYRAGLGNAVRDEIARLGSPVSQVAFDFLSLAMAITAADLFISRSDAPDGFARQIELTVALAEPGPWKKEQSRLEALLNFLSGDSWSIEFIAGGARAPALNERKAQRNKIDTTKANCICLFSGGLDSLIGAIDSFKDNRRPLLVSRASNKDGKYQKSLRRFLPVGPVLSINDDPRSDQVAEGSTRTRSILFLAFAACAASAVSSIKGGAKIPLLIPENGFIALNPPMTRRRYGALSTRTAHPHYLAGVQAIFDAVGIPAALENPYYFMTKGEAFDACSDPSLIKQLASSSVSCGKWKRANEQCGRCVPCLIRRAAFHRCNIQDTTKYSDVGVNLKKVLKSRAHNGDLVSVLYAIRKARGRALGQWVVKSGPLPLDLAERQKHIDVAQRGLKELEEFLKGQGIPA